MRVRIAVALFLLLAMPISLAAAWHYGADAVILVASHAVEWRKGGVAIALACIGVQTFVAGFGVLPASLTGMAIGFILGPSYGLLVAAVGTMAGAMLSFALARSALRPLVVAALARWNDTPPAQAGHDWRFVFMLRLSPILPFAPASFALGAMGIRWRDFVIGTVASLPSLAAYVWLGAATPALSSDWRSLSHPALSALFWLGLAVTMLMVMQWGGRLLAARVPMRAQ